MSAERHASAEWERLRRAVQGCPLPLALVDLDALEANVDRLTAPARAGGKRIRWPAQVGGGCPALLGAHRGCLGGAS